MRVALLLTFFLVALYAEARTLGSKEQKKEFAIDAISSVLETYDSPLKYKLDEKSIELEKCNEYGNYVNEPWMADPYDCETVYFYVRDKDGNLYTGKAIIDVELKKRFRFGIVPVKSRLPELDITTREYTDEKSKEQIYMGLSAANDKNRDQQVVEELMELRRVKLSGNGPRDKAPLTPVRSKSGKR